MVSPSWPKLKQNAYCYITLLSCDTVYVRSSTSSTDHHTRGTQLTKRTTDSRISCKQVECFALTYNRSEVNVNRLKVYNYS